MSSCWRILAGCRLISLVDISQTSPKKSRKTLQKTLQYSTSSTRTTLSFRLANSHKPFPRSPNFSVRQPQAAMITSCLGSQTACELVLANPALIPSLLERPFTSVIKALTPLASETISAAKAVNRRPCQPLEDSSGCSKQSPTKLVFSQMSPQLAATFAVFKRS